MRTAVEQREGRGQEGVVARLREQIRQLQAAPREYVSVLRTGIHAFDALLPGQGLPLGQAVELWGEAASGRATLALRGVAAATQEQRLAAWVDGPQELYPPAAAALGVDLARLLWVRPKAPGELVWTAVQLLRSGAFACVVLDLTHTGVKLGMAESKKLADAAQRGGTLLLLLTPPGAPADGMLRLQMQAVGAEGVEVEVLRSRSGGMGRRTFLDWGAFYPLGVEGLSRRKVSQVESTHLPALPRFHRTRFSDLRNGPCGLYASRPGRDAPFPALRSSFGG